MSILTSTPATLSVTSFPYSLPARGQAMAIGVNTAESVRPPTHSAYQWSYALFRYYGGGAFVEDYSAGGAFVIAGSGGHAVPPNFGGCLFDFADATWKRIDNANGMPWIVRDLNAPPEINDFGEINWPGVSAGIPAPAHLYGNVLPLSAANGGGSRGSALILHSAAAGYASNSGSSYAHRFDLSTGLWTRQSTNTTIGQSGFRTSCYDWATNRYYMLRNAISESASLDYLDGADWTWKTVSIGRPGADGNNKSSFIDEQRRLLVMQTSTGKLRALDLNDLNKGPVLLQTVGELPAGNESHWYQYPVDGCWYTYEGNGGNTLHKIQPPAANPLTGTWTASKVVIGGAALPSQDTSPNVYSVHHNRFFYVKPPGCFAWISEGSNRVIILKP